ncbi:TPA: hypothetical protein QCX97_005794 [Bacillus wiedmannii]|uniref:hypothetical protein n=1 Tax=Bacillus wiedmannii TaxID=1890302 RepID=UPI00065C023F|nr:hypothetical protein [Bacillus wiedmannii]KMP71373.1 hypothetical protein TU62_28750 [Bacillus cereus]MCQ6546692.1 hypothetical protein [Bacillus wiedmannii]MCQ6575236.1 hypothetical protein [Bacillus wiedmannii]WMS84154.1 hypothetical protein RE438_10695 [Bacillus wiedmannii]HDR7355898.1 hypothetical protein [Bacillus wiedmannii]
MELLVLEDLKDMSEEEVREHIVEEYEASKEEVEQYDILIAYESYGMCGCDSSSFFLLKHKQTGQLFENHGSHCSCFGFEEQFEPEETTLEYLKSGHFGFLTGGYDEDSIINRDKVMRYIEQLK